MHSRCDNVEAAWSHQRGAAKEALHGDECNTDEEEDSSKLHTACSESSTISGADSGRVGGGGG